MRTHVLFATLAILLCLAQFAVASPASLQQIIDSIPDDPAAAEEALRQSDRPLAKAWLAYIIFTTHPESDERTTTLERIGRELKEVLRDPPYRNKLNSLREVLEYTFSVHWEIQESGEKPPQWLFMKHPREAYFSGWPYPFFGWIGDTPEQERLIEIPEVEALRTFFWNEIQGNFGSPCTGTNAYEMGARWSHWWRVVDLNPKSLFVLPSSKLQSVQEYEEELHTLWGNKGIWNKKLLRDYKAKRSSAKAAMETWLRSRGYQDNDIDRMTSRFFGAMVWAAGTYGVWRVPSFSKHWVTPGLTVEKAAQTLPKDQDGLDHALRLCVLNRQSMDVVKFLMGKGARLDSGPENAAILAVEDPGYLKEILDLGATVDYGNCFDKTPLCYAVQLGAFESVKLLLERGADVNHTTHKLEGWAEFEKTAAPGCEDCYAVREEWSPIRYAVTQSSPEMVKLLLDHGASPEPVLLEEKWERWVLGANETLDEAQKKVVRKILLEARK